jgi:hypothetical protein
MYHTCTCSGGITNQQKNVHVDLDLDYTQHTLPYLADIYLAIARDSLHYVRALYITGNTLYR